MSGISYESPSISVVMPVYNCGQYVAIAIESILKQKYTDFEFIIIDDGSSDNSVEIIRQFKDSRIIFIRNETNKGNYSARNRGMDIAKGKYICVMDADDISEPERLAIQYEFMEKNPSLGICGTFIKNIPSGIIPCFITDYAELKVAFLFNNYCSHPSLMIRREILKRFDLKYNTDYFYSADYDLCVRALKVTEIQNIPYSLLRYRRHQGQISFAKYAEQEKYADIIRINQLIDILGFELMEIPVLLHLKLMKKRAFLMKYKNDAERWIRNILSKNKSVNYFNQIILERFLLFSLNSCMITNYVSAKIDGR